MKKLIAALLALSIVFALTACKNKPVNGETTTEPTGRPGSYVTDASGNVQTTADYYLELDESGQPKTEIIKDEDGSTRVMPVTRVGYEPITYPPKKGETLPATTRHTMPVNNTVKSNHEAWPTFKFMEKLPKAADTVDRVDHSDTETGEVAAIWINEMSYADFLKYIDKCKAAGFTDNAAATPPAQEKEGEYYAFVSNANGLWITVLYSTSTYASRFCDVMITVADYDVANSMAEQRTAQQNTTVASSQAK